MFTEHDYTSSNLYDFISRFITPGDIVLDAGCGAGNLTERAHEKCRCKIYAYDIDPEAVKTTQRRVTDSEVYLADSIRKTPLRAYDVVVANLDPTPAVQLLQECVTYLARNALIIITLPPEVSMILIEDLGYNIIEHTRGQPFNAFLLKKRSS